VKDYFYQVKYGDNRSHWLFGRFANKNAVMASDKGKVLKVLTTKQLIENHTEDEVRAIARNCLVYQVHALGEFPEDVAKLL